MQSAVRLDLVACNVADDVEPPKPGDYEVEMLKASDVPVVLEALKGERIYPVMALALSTGARRSELLALGWCEVDIKLGAIRIEHSLEQTKAGLRLISPKTKRGRRSISLRPLCGGTAESAPQGSATASTQAWHGQAGAGVLCVRQ